MFRSIRTKYIVQSSVLIALIAGYVFLAFFFTRHMKGEGKMINLAGRERMLTVNIALHTHMFLSSERKEDREALREKIISLMDDFETALKTLKNGNKETGLSPLHHQASISKLNEIIKIWEETQKPGLMKMLAGEAVGGGQTCEGCHSSTRDYLKKIERLVTTLETHTANESSFFDKFGVMAVIFFAAGAALIFLLINRNIVDPIVRLGEVVQRFKGGDLKARAEVNEHDEIGLLENNFNTMAQTIEAQLEDRQRSIIELWLLANTSNILAALPRDRDIFNAICEVAKRDFGVDMVWVGILEEDGGTGRHLHIMPSTDTDLAEASRFDLGSAGMEAVNKVLDSGSFNLIDGSEDIPLPFQSGKKFESCLILPLHKMDGAAFGVVSFYCVSRNYFRDDRINTYLVFANHASTSIENRFLIENLEEKVRERTYELEIFGSRLRKLYEMSFAVKTNAKEFSKYLLSELADMLDVEGAAIGVVDGEDWVGYTVADRAGLGVREGMKLPLKDVFCSEVIGTASPVVISDAGASDKYKNHPDYVKFGFRSYLGIPIFVGSDLFGVLCTFGKRPRTYSNYDLIIHQLIGKRLEFEFTKEKYEAELKEALRKADFASKAKSDFIANMTHELKTPLNTIIGYSTLVNEQFYGDLNEKQREFSDNVVESARLLEAIISDILDLTRIEAGKLQIKPDLFRIRLLLLTVISMMRENAARRGISLELSADQDWDPVIEGDERIIKQVMLNLLSNAVKFNQPGGTVTVRASTKSIKSEGVKRTGVEISVKDTGIGIREEDIPKLFKEFSQLEAPYTKNYGGTGLGLALTKRFIELHKGRIWVESEFEKGSNFTFVIPVRQNIPD